MIITKLLPPKHFQYTSCYYTTIYIHILIIIIITKCFLTYTEQYMTKLYVRYDITYYHSLSSLEIIRMPRHGQGG